MRIEHHMNNLVLKFQLRRGDVGELSHKRRRKEARELEIVYLGSLLDAVSLSFEFLIWRLPRFFNVKIRAQNFASFGPSFPFC
jgi:hypothetical protein